MIHLYIKRHRETGLQYFGVTKQNPFAYQGSGLRWRRHLKKYGTNIETLIVYSFNCQLEATKFALEFTDKYKITESSNWANIVPEDAKPGVIQTKETRAKISKTLRTKGLKTRGSKDMHWFNDGTICVLGNHCPTGFKEGRIFHKPFNKTKPSPNNKKKIVTPDGVFNMMRDYADFKNISMFKVRQLLTKFPNDYYLAKDKLARQNSCKIS